jgi:signal transduction histidine kinase
MLRLERHPIDPNYPVQAAVQTVRQMAEAKGVVIDTLLGMGLPTVEADSGRLQQVMWNLLVNAIKFTPAGGHVWVTTDAPEPETVRVRVRDDGVGIESDFLPHVFERFRQADGSATRQYGGLGIGLSLVHSLIEAHGGTVEVDSPGIGHGAVFTVLLPTVACVDS